MLLAEVERLRADQLSLSQAVSSDAGTYARSVADSEPTRFAEDVRAASIELVTAYAPVSGEVSAAFYEAQRPGPGVRVEIPEPSIGARLLNDLGWAFAPMFTPEKFVDPVGDAVQRIGSVVARSVLRAGRETMLLTAANDPLSGGVRRYARAGACGFCAYLSSIEAISSDDSVWHRNCTCVTVPWWQDNPMPDVKHLDRYAEASGWAREELVRRQREARRRHPELRSGNFFRQFPDLALNTRNLSALVRERLGLEH